MAASKTTSDNPIYHWGLSTLFICVSLSIYSYLGDCLINPLYAFENVVYLPAYLLLYLVSKSWAFIIVIPVYYFVFKKTKPLKLLPLKIIIVILIALAVSNWLYPDDMSLTIGDIKPIKLYVAYSLAFLTTMFIYEYKFKR